jgi:hypothetical protein
MATTYKTVDEALAGVQRPGWRIIGIKNNFEEVVDPNARTADAPKIRRLVSSTWTIQSPDGTQQDSMTIQDVLDPNARAGVAGISVVEGPSKNLSAGGNKQSDPSKWTPVYRTPGDPSSGQIGQWDPVNNEYHASAAASTTAKATGQYENVYDPRDPTGKKLLGFQDTGDHSFHLLPAEPDPTTGRQIVNTGQKILAVDKDNNVTELATIDKNSPFQAVIIDGKAYRFDPNEKDPSKAFVAIGPDNQLPTQIKDAQGNPMVLEDQPDGSKKYVYPPGVTPAATVSTNTTAKQLIWYDAQGNEIARRDNPNYQPPAGTALTPDLSAANIPVLQPDGTIKWVPNDNRVVASQAIKDLITQVTGKVTTGDMSMADAKDLLTGAVNTMNAFTSRANTAANVLSTERQFQTQTAQTGANLIANRGQATSNLLNQILGLGGNLAQSSAGRFGALGGGIGGTIPAGLGAGLIGEAMGITERAYGGRDTLDAAGQMVRAARPGAELTPMGQMAVAMIKDVFDRQQQQTGVVPPAVQAAAAANQSTQNGGITAPQPTPQFAGQDVQDLMRQQMNLHTTGFTSPPAPAPAPVPFAGQDIQDLMRQQMQLHATGFVAPPAPTININV